MPELNGRQRLELAMLCEDFDRAEGDVEAEQIPEMVALVRYVARESISRDHFSEHDSRGALHTAYVGASLLHRRERVLPGSFEHKVLAYAGFIQVDGIDPSDLEPGQAVPIEVRERIDLLADLIDSVNPDEPSPSGV